MYQNNLTDIPLRVPLGKDFAAAADAIPDLESHLRALFPTIREVSFRFRNPAPPPDAVARATYLHDASLILGFKVKTVAAAVIAAIAQEAIDFLKRRVKRIRPGRARYMRCRVRRREGRMANDAPIQTICPRCNGEGNMQGIPEKSCDACSGTGMVPIENPPPGAERHQ